MIPFESNELEAEMSASTQAENNGEERLPYAVLWVAGGEVYLYDDAPA